MTRLRALALGAAAIALGGALLAGGGGGWSAGERAAHASERRAAEFDERFRQAAVMLHARQYEHAVTALHRLLELDPNVPEVHVNMGFALLGLEKPAAARDFFNGAIGLRAAQANAYYGLAMALESLGDRPGALGAMRTYVHLAGPSDRWVPKARAALWEWQSESSR